MLFNNTTSYKQSLEKFFFLSSVLLCKSTVVVTVVVIVATKTLKMYPIILENHIHHNLVYYMVLV